MALTKAQAEEVIKNGGSVLYEGKLITKPEHLKFFEGTDEEKESEKAALKARLAELEPETTIQPDEAAMLDSGGVLDDTFDELNRHTRKELAETAAAEGVTIGESDTKAQIIEKILTARKSE